MISEKQRLELVAEFPELGDETALLPKELYAHYGLLFFGFSLVEHSLINSLTFHHVGTEMNAGKIRNRQQWEAAHDFGYDLAKKMTFGNLVKSTIKIEEFASLEDRLVEAKKNRDYFAHHFFREEVAVYMSDEGCWHLLYEFKIVKDKLMLLDVELRRPFETMCERLSLPLPTNEQVGSEASELIDSVGLELSSGEIRFGWNKK